MVPSSALAKQQRTKWKFKIVTLVGKARRIRGIASALNGLQIVLACLGLLAVSAPCQAKRHAFIVSIAVYKYPFFPKLDGPEADHIKWKATLERYDFKVTGIAGEKATFDEILKKWQEFLNSLEPDDETIVVLSGHGLQIKGGNYFIPYDTRDGATVDSQDILAQILFSIDKGVLQLADKRLRASIWIVDACRTNVFDDDIHGNYIGALRKGFHAIAVPPGTAVIYAAAPEHSANGSIDSTKPNSIFTHAFSKTVEAFPNLDITMVAEKVRFAVLELAKSVGKHQMPYPVNQIPFRWCFSQCAPESVKASYTTAKSTTNVALQREISTIVEINRLLSPPNAIFLGKKSATKKCSEARPSVDYPIGCEVLNALFADSRQSLIGKPIVARRNINIRKTVPSVDKNGKAVYPCVVGEIEEGAIMTVSGIFSVKYLDDEFLWGTIKSSNQQCAR